MKDVGREVGVERGGWVVVEVEVEVVVGVVEGAEEVEELRGREVDEEVV